MLRLVRNLFRKTSRKAERSLQYRPTVERLEEREVLSISASEQLFIYLLNRARHNPQAYAREHNLSVSLSNVTPRAPLAVNPLLTKSAEFKANEMADYNYFSHQSAVTGKWPNQIAREAGYQLPSYFANDANYIESIAYGWGSGQQSGVATAAEALNLLLVDAGINPPGHRIHLLGMDDFFSQMKEVGVGHAYRSTTDRNTDYWAIHTGWVNSSDVFLTGVVYADANGNGRYDLNEGLSGVQVQAGGLSTTTNAAGGWSLKVNPNSTYTVTAAGGGFSGTSSARAAVGTNNVEVDFLSGRGALVNFVDPNAAGRPSVTAPGSTVATLRPTVAWTEAVNADHFELVVTNQATGQQMVDLTSLTATTYTPGGDWTQGTYRVKVRGINSDGNPGPWSAGRSFTVNIPRPSAPTVTGPESPTANTQPTITWNAVANAASYRVVLNNLTTGAKHVIDQSGLTGTSFTPSAALDYGTYRVFVRAINVVGEAGAWSVTRDFRIKPVLTPTITGPSATTTDTTPTFTWTAADGADFYALVLNNLTTGEKQVLLVNGITGTSYTPSVALAPGKYKVKVQGYKSNGLTGAWSVGWVFTIE